MSEHAFFARGWATFPADPVLEAWVAAVAPVARSMIADPSAERRCEGTWFPGVNALSNDAAGAVAGGPALAGADIVRFVAETLALDGFAWDRAQVSVCYPGYPRHGAEESEAAFGYRLRRDAAHVDGLLRIGASRNRRLGETHGFILGAPLFGTDAPGASPLVVWEGSHEIMRSAFRAAFRGVAPSEWAGIDVTDAYQTARRRCFEACRRVEVSASPGEAYLVHRLALHGVAPWRADASAGPRAIAYLRPDPAPDADPTWWLEAP